MTKQGNDVTACVCVWFCGFWGALDDFFLTSSSRDMTATVLSNAALEKKEGNDVTASSSICDKERSLEDDYDVSKDNRNIGSDLDFDFDDLWTIERFLKPGRPLDEVFDTSVDCFCSRVSFVKVEDLELAKETMDLSADSIQDLAPNKIVDLEV